MAKIPHSSKYGAHGIKTGKGPPVINPARQTSSAPIYVAEEPRRPTQNVQTEQNSYRAHYQVSDVQSGTNALSTIATIAIVIVGALAFFLVISLLGNQARPELAWRIKNGYGATIAIEFHSGDRQYIWPGQGKVYLLNAGDVRTIRLSCQLGQKICFGAWEHRSSQDFYWGVGPRGEYACSACCRTCNGQMTDLINLQ